MCVRAVVCLSNYNIASVVYSTQKQRIIDDGGRLYDAKCTNHQTVDGHNTKKGQYQVVDAYNTKQRDNLGNCR